MRSLARLGPAFLGLLLAVPATGRADQFSTTASPAPQVQHHRGLFRSCQCPECQRARVKARDGVDVPAPPPVPANIVSIGDDRGVPGAITRRTMFGGKDQECVACQEGTIVSAPVMMGGEMPGRAVVGGTFPMAEPVPIGQVRGAASNANKRAVAGRRGKKDPDVATTQFSSPTPLAGPTHNPPRVIQHLFGLDAIGKLSAERAERRIREKHASIAYGEEKARTVTDVPASVVYKGVH